MNFSFVTALPGWWILVCAIAGFLYAFFLYRRETAFDNNGKWLVRTLFLLRSVLVFFLCLLLLTPLIKTFTHEKEKPIVVIAQDNSASIIIHRDSSFYRNEYRKSIDELAASLKDKFDVRTVSWGDKLEDGLSYSYKDKQTDFTTLFDQLAVRYGNRNTGAVIIASDGLYNRGSNPVYASGNLKVPFYTIALGDTTVHKDIFISRINYNKIVYLGNSFPIEITVDARQCNGAQTVLTVTQDSTILSSREIRISGNKFTQLVPVVLEAKKTGIIHYKINVSSVAGEATVLNNEKDIFIEVVESKQKVLIVCNSPHPDIAALKNSIESNQNYEVKVKTARDDLKALNEFNLIILHNLPSNANPVNDLLNSINTNNIPAWFIIGSQISATLFNKAGAGMTISDNIDKVNPVKAIVNNDFSLFNVSEGMRQLLPGFPELLSPFGHYRNTAGNSVLLNQQIGAVGTSEPLQVFSQVDNKRTGVLCGEGLWRWKMSEYAMNGNNLVFNEWVLKTIQNLGVKENKTHFRLVNKNNFAENEPVTFDAEVYNDNYELVNIPDVNITITNRAGKSFPYTFSKTDKAYTLNGGYMPAGDYRYKATVKLADKSYTSSGEFSVSALQAEQGETVADHQLLYALAKKNGGEMFYPSQIDELKKNLLAREDIKTVTYSHYQLRDLVDIKLIFFILMGLLSIEWFVRKRSGAY
jgi:hypothetical protein